MTEEEKSAQLPRFLRSYSHFAPRSLHSLIAQSNSSARFFCTPQTEGAETCTFCPSGKANPSATGSSSSSVCSDCDAGKTNSDDFTGCANCTAGKYGPSVGYGCFECGSGKVRWVFRKIHKDEDYYNVSPHVHCTPTVPWH